MAAKSRTVWTLALTSAALFMASLDNLVVTTALPVDPACICTPPSRVWSGPSTPTRSPSPCCCSPGPPRRAVRPPPDVRHRPGRVHRWVGGGRARARASAGSSPPAPCRASGRAIIVPLTLTLLSAAVPAAAARHGPGHLGRGRRPRRRHRPARRRGRRRGRVVAVDLLAERPDRHRAAAASPARRLTESRTGRPPALDLPGVVLASAWACSGSCSAWSAATTTAGQRQRPRAPSSSARCWWRRSSPGSCAPATPMLPMRLFRSRGFTVANVASLLMFFGMFGSIFLLAQFLQAVQGYRPLEAGLRILPWTGDAGARRPDRRRPV